MRRFDDCGDWDARSPWRRAHEIPEAEEGMALPMAATRSKVWTVEELHSLPDDGNEYELIRGELFVTSPTDGH